ncbi:MAG: stage II sporulation protein M [Lentisphaerae bacterium]|nr:stage II sporulation protein M [Lentisphaerota bacterium]
MIIDLQKFIASERPYWTELEGVLRDLDRAPLRRMTLPALRRFHYLYERVSADLARLATFGAERETRTYLETLVARAYGETHETRRAGHRLRPLHWFFAVFPSTVRRHAGALRLSAAVTVAGCLFGALAVMLDPDAREVLMPLGRLLQHPDDRVAREESALDDELEGSKAQGAAWYMTHNTRVAIGTMAMGATWGIGTGVLLFYNGTLLGAVAADYVAAGQTRFLLGWLLPHGSVEIPAILLAGQAGLVLAGAMLGRRRRMSFKARLRAAGPDVVTLIFGVALLLVWAGIVEAFLSQYHAPTIPYAIKIAFGALELVLLTVFLARSGRKAECTPDT